MKRSLILLLILSLTLNSCAYIGATEDILIGSASTGEPNNSSSLGSVTESSQITTTTDNRIPVGDTLTLNTNSKKIHYFDSCSYAKRMNEENKATVSYDELTSLLADGYTVCSWCEKIAKTE